jgi:hypothetical protein
VDKKVKEDAMDVDGDDDGVKLTPAAALYQCMLKTGKNKDDNRYKDDSQERQYVQFLHAVLKVVVEQCRQEVQGWQDFEFVWTTVFQDKSHTKNGLMNGGGGGAGVSNQEPSKVSKYFHDAAMLETALLLEPAIPGLPDSDATMETTRLRWCYQIISTSVREHEEIKM